MGQIVCTVICPTFRLLDCFAVQKLVVRNRQRGVLIACAADSRELIENPLTSDYHCRDKLCKTLVLFREPDFELQILQGYGGCVDTRFWSPGTGIRIFLCRRFLRHLRLTVPSSGNSVAERIRWHVR